MRFLITGGAGFLGIALANHLVANGHHVRVLDDLSMGDPSRLDGRVLFSRGDVRNVPVLWTHLQDVECVYHLAARVAVPESVLYPQEYNDVNVGGTVALLTAMRDVDGVRRVVLASSATVYGEQPLQPVHEGMIPNPGSPYAVSKIAAEQYLRTLSKLYGLEAVVVRIFNAYGPGQPLRASFPAVIPSFIQRVLSGGSVIMHGDGASTRDFVYLDDVIDALVTAATAPGIDRRVINVGSGAETSVADLLRLIEHVTGRDAQVVNSKTEAGASRMCADLTQAAALLAYAPRYALADGLRETIQRDPRFKR